MTEKTLSALKQLYGYRVLPLAIVAVVCAGRLQNFFGTAQDFLVPMALLSAAGYLVLALMLAQGKQGGARAVWLQGLSLLVILACGQRLMQNLLPSWWQILTPQLAVDYWFAPFAPNRLSSLCALGLIFLNLALLTEERFRCLAIFFTVLAWLAGVFALNGLVLETSFLAEGVSFFSVACLLLAGLAMALRLSEKAPFLVLFKRSGLGWMLRLIGTVLMIEPVAIGLFVSTIDSHHFFVSSAVTQVVAVIACGKLVLLLWVASVFDHNQTRLQQAADFDHLTGLLNRHGLERQLAEQRFNGVVMLDIDCFKQINDALGHAEGDRILVTVAKMLAASKGCGNVLARWGGDEFILLTQERDAEGLQALRERLRVAQASLPKLSGWGASVTLSLGFAQIGFGSGGLLAAVSRADQALYAAKHARRSTVCGEKPKMEQQGAQRADTTAKAK